MTASGITYHYINVRGKRIHYIEKSANSPITILFIHGRAMSVCFWEKQFSSEILSSFRLIALDLPGHGLSDHCEDFNGNYGLSAYKEILTGFIDNLGLRDYILAGLSIGGNVVLQALPYLQNVKGAFVMTMPVIKPMAPNLMFKNIEIINKAYGIAPSGADINNYVSILFRPKHDSIPAIFQEVFNQTDAQVHVGILNEVIDGNYQDETEIIKKSKNPIAIVVGNDDQIHDLTYLNGLNLPVWRQPYQKVAGAGHLLNWENPVKVNSLLMEFVMDCFEVIEN